MGAGNALQQLSGWDEKQTNILEILFADFHGVHCFYPSQSPDTSVITASSQNS